MVRGEEGEHTIFSDSQSALQTLQSPQKPPMALSIQVKIKEATNKNKIISLCLVPGYCGVAR